MAVEIIMPKVDMVMETGTFVEWLKDEGEEVSKGEPLFVIITEKASIECESPASGLLGGCRAKQDDVIPVTEVIGYILEPGEQLPAPKEPQIQPEISIVKAEIESGELETAKHVVMPETGHPTRDGKARATPVARRLAVEMGIDLASVPGRGPRGRIHKADVLAFAERQPVSAAPQPLRIAPSADLQVTLPDAVVKAVVPLAGPRRLIAERMAYSAATAPHFMLSLNVDMSEAARLRARLLERVQERTGTKLSYTAILSLATARVLTRHPFLNASLNGTEIIQWQDVHLGIATSLEDALIVPVIRKAQDKNLEQITSALGDLVERAREKHLTPTEMSGSTFTISNLGMFDIESFTAIINPPESAILAVGKIVKTPVDVDGEIRLRPIMNMTLSVDHRVVDGAGGARFLSDLKSVLENPYLLI
jgi:pyruvate dehydrogenase E2 component (dihydrolipoamide acetyltransferase)